MNTKKVVVFLSDYGWPQSKIAKKLKVSRARVSQILKGHKPRLTRCDVCGVGISEGEEVRIKVKGVSEFVVCEDCRAAMGRVFRYVS